MGVAVKLICPGRVELARTRPTGRLWNGGQGRDRTDHRAGRLRARRRLAGVEVDVVGASSARVRERDRAARGDRHGALARVRRILEPEVKRVDARRQCRRRRVSVGSTRRDDCRRAYEAQRKPGYRSHCATIPAISLLEVISLWRPELHRVRMSQPATSSRTLPIYAGGRLWRSTALLCRDRGVEELGCLVWGDFKRGFSKVQLDRVHIGTTPGAMR